MPGEDDRDLGAGASGAPARRYAARLDHVIERNGDTRSLFLRLAPGRTLTFQPGQFISVTIPSAERDVVRPYSIASDPGEELVEVVLNRVPGGVGSAHLFALSPGAEVNFTGPWGAFVVDRAAEVERVFIAQGTGVAPILPMVRAAVAAPGKGIGLLYAARRDVDVLFRAEIESVSRQWPRFAFEIVIEGEGPDADRHEPLRRLVTERYVERDSDRTRQFYVCGVGAIVTDLRNLLRQAGYERRNVRYEKW